MKVEGRVHQVLKLESEADNIYHEEMAKLFTECTDPIEIIKWKEILSAMEGCNRWLRRFGWYIPPGSIEVCLMLNI